MLGAGTAGKLSQAMVKDVAGACHDLVPVVHGLGDDDRHQTVDVGHLQTT